MRKSYSEYKNTKIDWLETIPQNWKLVKLKHVSSLNMGQSPSSDDVNQEGEGIPFIQGNAEFGALHPTPKNFCTEPSKLCSPDDILISVRAPVGALNIADQEYVIGRGLSAITPKSVSRDFCWYALQNSKYQLSIMETGTTFKAISGTDLANVVLPLPSPEEQKIIEGHLNFETSRIDRLIAEKAGFIDLLKEKRQALISHVVTKGLDPDVEMKDSGVEWIGEIPKHWNVIKLKWIANTESGGTPTSSNYNQYYENGTIPWIRTTDLNNSSLYETPVKITDDALRDTACSIIPKGSVLVAMYGGAGSIGKHSLLCFDSAINQAVCAIIPSPKLNPRFLHRFVEFYRPFWMVEADGTRKDPNINQDIVKNLWIPLPPVEEQERISDFIDWRTNRIESLIEETKRSIDLLKEHRTALISAAVTGKIDLRDKEVA